MKDEIMPFPAFPGAFFKTSMSEQPTYYPGMTLRDYFAAQALISIVPIAVRVAGGSLIEVDSATAKTAYRVADAMLAERSKA